MAVYDHILVPIEGTETDASGARARRQRWPPPAAPASRCCASRTSTRATSALRDRGRRGRPGARRGAAARRGLEVETLLLSGEPQDVIVQQADELRPDLIAMATHGHGWAKRMVLGSVADHLRHNTDVPLLLLKGGAGT